MKPIVYAIALICALSGAVMANGPTGFHALASVDLARTLLLANQDRLSFQLGLSNPVPFRAVLRDDPHRLVLDFQEVDWAGVDKSLWQDPAHVRDLRFGTYRLGWSRMVIDLAETYRIDSIEMKTTGDAPLLNVALIRAEAAPPPPPDTGIWADDAVDITIAGDGPLRVAIDPGHGGIDPGAIRNGVAEKDIALEFSRDLRRQLLDMGGFSVFLTRSEDEFVSLRDRVRRAQAAEADVFLSIHANTVTEGDASGATIYSLSEKASDAASAKLAELENRADISAGLDLTAEEDDIAKVLIDMARTETNARSAHFAAALVDGMQNATGTIRSRPHRSAGFKVLKAPDMPSLLLELGFLSNATDLLNMQDPAWRQRAADGVVAALRNWAAADRVLSQLVMK